MIITNWEALLYPLSPKPFIPVGLRMDILSDGSLQFHRHFHLYIPRQNLILDLPTILSMIPPTPDLLMHTPVTDLDPTAVYFQTTPLDPTILLSQNPLSTLPDNLRNRAKDLSTLTILRLFNNCQPGPLRNTMPHSLTLPNLYSKLAGDDLDDDSD